jgi:transcriptional regulator with XRE-family HTH domain
VKRRKSTEPDLACTLAIRVSQLRERRNLTVADVARLSRFSIKRVEEIEAGIEVWLSVTDRAILARVLGVQPSCLEEAEACPSDLSPAAAGAPRTDFDDLARRVLKGEVNLACPKCGTILKTAIENALDFEGEPTRFARAYCPACPFALH